MQAGQTLCLLANHRRLFVVGRAFKSEAEALADEAPRAWPPQGPGTIHHLSNQADSGTRTFAVYLPLENQPRPPAGARGAAPAPHLRRSKWVAIPASHCYPA